MPGTSDDKPQIDFVRAYKKKVIAFKLIIDYTKRKQKGSDNVFDLRTFGENLRSARQRRGYSQRELAEKLFISTQAISKWERGETAPDLMHTYSLAEILHISIDALTGVNPSIEKALIAVDGGGTKTEFVLINTAGHLLKRVLLPGSNPNTCSIQGTVEVLQQGIDTLLRENYRVLAVYIGGAGMLSGANGEKVQHILRKSYPYLSIGCGSDVLNVLTCAEDPDNAIAVICGTGSVVYGTCQGKLYRCGGGGWKLETLGSGYDIGRCGLLAALEDRDSTGKQTMLTLRVEQKLGGKLWDQIQQIYNQNPAFIASFAPLVLDAWQAGDEVAAGIVKQNCARIAELVNIAAQKSPNAKQVLFGGSLLTESEPFRVLIKKMLHERLRADVMPFPQIWGACLLCAKLAGIDSLNPEVFMAKYVAEG